MKDLIGQFCIYKFNIIKLAERQDYCQCFLVKFESEMSVTNDFKLSLTTGRFKKKIFKFET